MLYRSKNHINKLAMRLRIVFSIAVCIVATCLCSSSAYGQCNAKTFEKSNILRLSKNFSHIHTFELNKANSKGELKETFIFNKGTLYMLNVSNFRGQEKDIIVELYNQKGELVATNYNKVTDRYWPIGYVCKESGVHTLKFRFVGTKNYCGICVVGSKK